MLGWVEAEPEILTVDAIDDAVDHIRSHANIRVWPKSIQRAPYSAENPFGDLYAIHCGDCGERFTTTLVDITATRELMCPHCQAIHDLACVGHLEPGRYKGRV